MSLFTEKMELGVQEAELETRKVLGGLPAIFRWLVILIIIGLIPAYFIAKSVSYKIWLARYQQGAIMAKPSFTNPQAILVSPINITTLGTGQYAAVVKISNANLDLSLEKIPYSLNFYNSKGQEVYTFNDSLFLLPNQTKYLTAPTFATGEQIASSTLQLPPNLPWQKRLQIPQVDLETSLPSAFYQTSPQAFVAQGDFLNNSPYTLNKVRLTFVLYNSTGQIIGSSQRDESTVSPFERRAYKQLWPNAQVPDFAKVEVTADTDTLDPNNLSIAATPPSSSSDLSRPSSGNQ